MKKFNVALVILCLFGFGSTTQAQNTIPASGGNASGGGGTVSYSIGQVVYITNTSITSGSVAQGVQQPFEISVITGLEEAKDISLDFSVFPNPATDFIRLKIENYKIENLKYQLYDINGNLLQNNKVEGNETNISMQSFFPATYFLKVIQGNKVIETFKIIKN